MIAEIDAQGVLKVSAETPLESYALQVWSSINTLPAAMLVSWHLLRVVDVAHRPEVVPK